MANICFFLFLDAVRIVHYGPFLLLTSCLIFLIFSDRPSSPAHPHALFLSLFFFHFPSLALSRCLHKYVRQIAVYLLDTFMDSHYYFPRLSTASQTWIYIQTYMVASCSLSQATSISFPSWLDYNRSILVRKCVSNESFSFSVFIPSRVDRRWSISVWLKWVSDQPRPRRLEVTFKSRRPRRQDGWTETPQRRPPGAKLFLLSPVVRHFDEDLCLCAGDSKGLHTFLQSVSLPCQCSCYDYTRATVIEIILC